MEKKCINQVSQTGGEVESENIQSNPAQNFQGFRRRGIKTTFKAQEVNNVQLEQYGNQVTCD